MLLTLHLWAAEPDAATLGSWVQVFFYILVAICAIVGATAAIITAIKKSPPKPESELVTRGEMERQLGGLRTDTAREFGRIDTDIKEFKTYFQTRMHDHGNKLHAINIRIVWMMGLLTQLAKKTDGVSIPSEPTISTPDEA